MPQTTGDTTDPTAKPAAAPAPQSAGRGLAFILAAKIWFLVGGGILNFVLPYLLPSREEVGKWVFLVSVVSPLNNVMVTATIQAVSKFASRGPEWVEATKRTALRLQLFVAVPIGVAYFFVAPWIAERIEHDAAVGPAIMLSTGVVLSYAFYAVFVGAANGARQFHKQAGLDMTYTTLRAGLVCAGAVVTGTIVGSTVGFVAASTSVLVVSLFVVGLRPVPADAPRVAPREMLAFMAPVALYLLVSNFLMFVDGWVLKRLMFEWAPTAHLPDPAKVANDAMAIYGQAQNFARLPYQMILAVTFVIFPLVSQSTFAADTEKTRGYIIKALRLSFIVVSALAAGVAAKPEGLLSLLPKGQYLDGGPALAVLAFAYVGFSLLSIAGTITNGAGHATVATIIGVGTLALDGLCNYSFVGLALAHDRDPLQAAAIASAVAIGAGCVASLVYLHRVFGASLPLLTVARVGLAVAAALGAGYLVPLHGKAALAGSVVGGLAYLATLAVTREVTAAEVKALARRGK